MPTREQVLALVRTRRSYPLAAKELGIPPGQAYLIATGIPADGSGTAGPDELGGAGSGRSSTQDLVHPEVQAARPELTRAVHDWMAGRAKGDAQMQEATPSTTAPLARVGEEAYHDIASVVTRDHNQVVALLRQLAAIPGVTKGGTAVHRSRRASILDMVAVVLARHESTEEEVLWPAVREHVEDGEAFRATALGQEQQERDIVVELATLDPSTARFDERCGELEAVNRRHVAFEDRVLLALRDAMTREDQDELGARFRRREADAQARPGTTSEE